MKTIYRLALIICLLVGFAQANPLNVLIEGEILRQGICSVNDGETYACIVIGAKDNYVYLVQLDEKGEKDVYIMTDNGWALFWSRESV